MATTLDNVNTIKLGQNGLTAEQWRLIKLATNASNVVYNIDLPWAQLPDGMPRIEPGYVLDNQRDWAFQGGIAQPYASESGWTVINTQLGENTGAKAAVFFNSSTNEIMVTFAGMDGMENGKDVGSAVAYNATNQIAELKSQIESALNEFVKDPANKNLLATARWIIDGQSMGAANAALFTGMLVSNATTIDPDTGEAVADFNKRIRLPGTLQVDATNVTFIGLNGEGVTEQAFQATTGMTFAQFHDMGIGVVYATMGNALNPDMRGDLVTPLLGYLLPSGAGIVELPADGVLMSSGPSGYHSIQTGMFTGIQQADEDMSRLIIREHQTFAPEWVTDFSRWVSTLGDPTDTLSAGEGYVRAAIVGAVSMVASPPGTSSNAIGTAVSEMFDNPTLGKVVGWGSELLLKVFAVQNPIVFLKTLLGGLGLGALLDPGQSNASDIQATVDATLGAPADGASRNIFTLKNGQVIATDIFDNGNLITSDLYGNSKYYDLETGTTTATSKSGLVITRDESGAGVVQWTNSNGVTSYQALEAGDVVRLQADGSAVVQHNLENATFTNTVIRQNRDPAVFDISQSGKVTVHLPTTSGTVTGEMPITSLTSSSVNDAGQLVMTVDRDISGHRVKVEFVEDEWGDLKASRVLTVDGLVPANDEPFVSALNSQGYSSLNFADGQAPSGSADVGSLYAAFNPMQPTGAQTLANAINQYGGTVIDALSMIKAIQSGDPLPITVSGLRLANDISNFADGPPNYNLSGAASVGGSILSILSLEQALQRGDTLAAVTAGAQALSFGAQAYANFAFDQALSGNLAFIDSAWASQAFAESIGKAMPYLNLVNSISNGDEIGAGIAALQIINAAELYAIPGINAIAIAYTVFTIVSSLFGDDDSPPEAWGNAWAGWSGFSAITNSNGGDGGQTTAQQTYEGFISYLNQLAANEQALNPGSAIGVIANRLPSLSYHNYTGFGITDIDAITGVQRNPEIRYDLSGRPYNAPAGSEQASQSLSERFIRVALARGAIAPMWEVQTAALQTQAGDPQAGLTEEERAGRNGQLSTQDSALGTQVFRAVALDLNGDGVQTTGANRTVAFDVDDSGFLKNTAWLNSNDGFLFLDRNLNGSIDSGRELFSNSIVDLSARGLAGMRWIDSNYDGRLTDADPVWDELKVWQDADGDGQADAGEAQTLSALGITALDYAMGRFEQNGQLKEMSSPDLVADTAGTRTHVISEGIVVETTNGHTSLLVTRIDDRTVIEANRDGITSYEDIETIVSTADLMANDMLGGFVGQNLTVTGAFDFTHGTGYLDGNGFIHYNPAANYYGPASFSYTIQAPTGQTATATVDLNIQNVNDAPTATVDQHIKPLYGYASVEYVVYGVMENQYIAAEPRNPQYAPYVGNDYTNVDPNYPVPPNDGGFLGYFYSYNYGNHNTIIRYQDSDGPNIGTIVVSDIDDPAGQFSYEVIAQPQKGLASIDANGNFQYTNWYGPNTPGDDGSGTTQPDPFTVNVTDPHGASTTLQVSSVHEGAYYPSLGSGGGGKKPISIDLGNDGFGFTNIDDSNIFFDINGDGFKHRIAWPTADDGLLAYDIDGNGKIEHADEISFAGYKYGAQTDLEGLKAFDTNGDGIFSAADDKWSKFGVWQDANQNGITDPGEFHTLADMGVASIALTSDGQFSVIDDQTVHGVATATKTDGSTLNVADVTLQYSSDVQVTNADGSQQVVSQTPFSPSGEELNGTDANDLILGKTGNNIVNAGAGDDVVMEDGGNDVIDGGDGNDTIYAGADADLVIGGTGDDVVFAGLANDMVLGGDGHDALFGEGGNDVIFGGKGNDLISGDSGNDVISGDAGDDQVYGGSGNDAVFGGEGNDELAGMSGYDRLDGGAGNDLLDGGTEADEMIGGAGDDIYVVDTVDDIVTENPGEGIDSVRSSISYALGANLENLTLTGNENLIGIGNDADNMLTGNSGANTLMAGAGNDTLDGGLGADTLIGGTGDDVYVVDNAADVVTEAVDEGNDTVFSSVSYGLAGNVENLVLTGRTAIDATGNTFDNVITGNIADNVLDGGIGADTLAGGRGNDTYVVDNIGDQTIELANAGVDTVVSSLSWTLADNVENLALTGTADLNGSGNELDNVLIGNSGNNRIDGGSGMDTMAGGAGDDVYVVDNVADMTMENAGEGIDTVYASASYGLAAHVENLVLAGTAAINASGNELDNTLTGNDSSNQLFGGNGNDVLTGNGGGDTLDGGTGADTMAGGQDDDVYVVDNAGDAVMENAAEGTDTVLASISYKLAANVENLALTGASDISASGNELDNVLLGNTGSNFLDGATGADTMAGGAGDDTYIVDTAGDQVVENAAEGNDTVEASVDYALTGNVENLSLTGAANLTGTGNELDNRLTGNAGNNMIDGGTGADIMAGRAGDDVYIVDNADDAVMENAAEGIDTVLASVSYSLAANVENLVLTGAEAISATGNELDNMLVGNDSSNQLFGGDGNDALTGNGGNDMLDGGIGADAMAGGADDDAYIVDNMADTVDETMGEGIDTVYASVTYGLAANVENLILTGTAAIDATGNELDNAIIGNDGDNLLLGASGDDTLIGNGGDDILDGGTGSDVMAGGAGNDTYAVESIGDRVVEQFDAGIDDVYASISYVLPENVENLTLTGMAIEGFGNGLDNMIVGNREANLLDGGTGADTMAGGAGDDAYIADNTADRVIEATDEGNDSVFSSANYALSDNLENLTLTGTDAINGSGNDLDNTIVGNAADNVLDGSAGADAMSGGAGDDTYIVDNAGDTITERADEGSDTAISSVSYGLAANVENLVLAGTANIDGTGNVLDNILVGNAGNNRLTGDSGNDVLLGNEGDDLLDGGTGNDRLDGGIGNDTYLWRGGDGLDVISDSAGNNTVQFGDGLNLDNLALRVTTGNGINTAHIRMLNAGGCETADQGFDFIVGKDAGGKIVSPIERFRLADGTLLTFDDLSIKTVETTVRPQTRTVITGRNDDIIHAGPTSDLIRSGTGNDIVYAFAAGDTIYGEGGNDVLFGGSAADTLDGGCGNDILTGGNGKDVLRGGNGNNLLDGGYGEDTLTDGTGNSLFVGSKGDDMLILGGGRDMVAFNRGDGQDIILGNQNLTLSLGSSIAIKDLALSRNGQDLVMKMDGRDSLTLKDWYAGHGTVTLQTIQQENINTFDFNGVVDAFDAMKMAAPKGPDRWSIASVLPNFQISSSHTEALGGDLAYRYGNTGGTGDLSSKDQLAMLSDASFGEKAQAVDLQPTAETSQWPGAGGSPSQSAATGNGDSGIGKPAKDSSSMQDDTQDGQDKPKDPVQSRIDAMLHRWFESDSRSPDIYLSQYQEMMKGGDQGRRHGEESYAERWQQLQSRLNTHFAASPDGLLGGSYDHGENGSGLNGLASLGVDFGKGSSFGSGHGTDNGGFRKFAGLREGLAPLSW